MRLSRNSAGASSALSSGSHLPTHQQTAAAQRTLAGGSRPFWEGVWGGFSRHRGVGVLATRADGGRKVDGRWMEGGRKVAGRWTEGGQRTPVSVSSSKR